jgi:hypothetical protein
MKLEDILARLGRDHFYLMHLSYNSKPSREPLWRYASEKSRIGLDMGGIDKNWFDIPEPKRRKALNWFWYDQFRLFCEKMSEGDCVIVMDGLSYLLGIGIAREPYLFGRIKEAKRYPLNFFRHVRPVQWLLKYDYADRVALKVPTRFGNTIAYVDSSSSRWELVNAEFELTNRDITRTLAEIEGEPVVVQPSNVSEEAIERVRKGLRSGQESRIDIELEISNLMSRSRKRLPRVLKRKQTVKAGSDVIDVSATVNLSEADVQLDIYPVYVPMDFGKAEIERFREHAKKLREAISKIERTFGVSNEFTRLCIDYTPNRDAFGFEGHILCNLVHYRERLEFNFWLVTLAREFAYLLHPVRDMKHMNLMRELLVKAMKKST